MCHGFSKHASWICLFFWKSIEQIQLLENNGSIILCWPLPHIKTNQPHVYLNPLPPEPPPILSPSHPKLSQNTGLGSLVYTANSHCYLFTYGNVYVSRYSPNSSHFLLPAVSTSRFSCSLCLHLPLLPENEFIRTIFLQTPYADIKPPS